MKKSPYVDPERRGRQFTNFFSERKKIKDSPLGIIFNISWGVTIAGFLFAVVLLFDIFSNEAITHEHVISVEADFYMSGGVKTLTSDDIIKTREGSSIKVPYTLGAIVEKKEEIIHENRGRGGQCRIK